MRRFWSTLVAAVLVAVMLSGCAGTPELKTYTDPGKPPLKPHSY